MTTPFPPACVFLCDVDRGLFLNPRTNRVGLPVQEHPRVRLGSNITLKYILVRGGAALAIPSGTLITVSLSDRDPQLSPRPFYNAPAVAVAGETGAVLASYDLSSPEMAGFRTGPIWFSIFVNDTAVLVDRGVLESGAWSYPLPATPFQETVVEIDEGGTIALRPTPTIYVTDEVAAEDVSRTIAVSNAALAEDTFYDCNRLLIKVLGENGAELLFPGADYIIGSAWRAGWWLCKIRQYPDSTVGVEIGSAQSPGSGFTDVSDLTDITGLLFSGDYDDLDNKPTIPTDVNQLADGTGILTAKEAVANKTQAVDAEDPSADKFPSEAALVDYVEDAIPVIPPIPADLSDLSDETGILAGKEPSTNKATDFTVVDDTKFPTTQAVASYVDAIPAATESSRGTIALATAEEAAAGVDAGKAITAATLMPLVDTKEAVANKTQEIDAVTPSADKYTSEAAVVAHVAGLIPDVPDDLSDLSDDTGILAGKEPAANKATDFTTVNNTLFPTTQAVASYVDAIPAATEGARGTIALATAGEATAGTDQSKAITPATLGAVLEDAIPVIPSIPADLSDLSDTTGILTAKESAANKTQAIDAVTPSADKYTSEAAVVAHVEGAVTDALGDIEAVLDELIGGTP